MFFERMIGLGLGLLMGWMMFGCAPVIFHKPGSGQAELEQDRYACQLQVQSGPFAMAYARDPMANMGYPFMARQEMRDCLEHRGWRSLTEGEAHQVQQDQQNEFVKMAERVNRLRQQHEEASDAEGHRDHPGQAQ